MILSDKSIRRELDDSGRLVVEPQPTEKQIQPPSLGVRLGEKLYNVDTDYTSQQDDFHRLEPNTRYLGHTVETINLSDDLAAQLTGRSTFGRLFVTIHQTAGWIDPSFEGQITLEIMNFGNSRVFIDIDDRVGQLVFFELDQPSSGYDGKYQGQNKIQKAVIDE